MSVDLEAIARLERCDATSLRHALPLLEQGYLPPFLARYRQDELGGLSESALWALLDSVRAEEKLQQRRQELQDRWQQTAIQDPAIERMIREASNRCMLDRIGRRLRGEPTEQAPPAQVLAARLLSPQPGDAADPAELASSVADESALSGLDAALADRLASDPRLIQAGVRWLAKNARIQVLDVADPHLGEGDGEGEGDEKPANSKKMATEATAPEASAPEANAPEANAPEASAPEASAPEASAPEASAPEASAPEASAPEASAPEASAPEASAPEASAPEASVPEVGATDAEALGKTPESEAPAGFQPPAKSAGKSAAKRKAAALGSRSPQADKDKAKPKKKKKISPRQRRRRWLVGVLQPLAGKTHSPGKLTAFQKVMLGRALRSQVANCAFQYDAAKLTAHLQKFAAQLNPAAGERLQEIVARHETLIRETCEGAWWDELLDAAANHLVRVAADHLRKQMLREPVEARVVLSIDAIGPQTVAIAVVTADGRLLATEDLPCQLSTAARQQAVTRLGELLHQYHVDLIVVSNGPARRATLVLLNELLEQSQKGSLRWALADRSGADLYASGPAGNREMRSTPRRFRAATWLAFQVLTPAQALTKVDPTKLRLGSFQRELSDDALAEAVTDVLISGVSSDGVDVNGVDPSWLARLPGMTEDTAAEIHRRRQEQRFASRTELDALAWPDQVARNQALGFLRVFGSEQTLDGTLIHPSDYALAEKLMNALQLPAPPPYPPGYVAPEDKAAGNENEAAAKTAAEPETEAAAESETEAAAEPETEAAAESETEAAAESETAAAEPETAAAADAETVAAAEPEAQAAAESETEEPLQIEGFGKKAAPAAPAPAPVPVTVVEPYRHPLPERAEVQKRVKEWQIGRYRAQQIVKWVCDPFSGGGAALEPPTATMERVPKLSELQIGTKVAGIVVGVAGFGVFVELGPDCNGLIHVSRLSDRFVEDMNEAVQVGDVMVAWVTGVDAKRRRVALSAVSPQREAELNSQRQSRTEDRGRGGGRGGAGRSGAASGDRQHGGGQSSVSRGAGQQRGGKPAAGRGRGGDGPRRGHDSGQRDSQRRGNRDSGPRTFTKVARDAAPPTPISDAMEKGDEPLRSFGDLAQFLKKKTAPEPAAASKPKEIKPQQARSTEPAEPAANAEPPAASEAQAESAPSAKPAPQVSPEQAAPEQVTPEQVAPEPAATPAAAADPAARTQDPSRSDDGNRESQA